MDFEAELAKFLGQPTMKSALKSHAVAAIKSGGGGVAASLEDAKKFVEEAKKAIIDSLPEVLRASNYHAISVSDLISSYVGITDDGKFQFELSWNPAAVHRPSLYQKKYPNGIEDIVGLFHSGTKASRHSVWGRWHDHRAYLPQGWYREAERFLDDAISAFNTQHQKDGVTLTLLPTAEYYH